jgi:DNA repair protein RecO (recombination protein O)
VLETAERLTAEEREPALRLHLLVVGALRALAVGAHDPSLVLDAFLVRAMSSAGWEPALDTCARCGEPGPHRAFSVPAGGAVCPECRPAGSSTPDAESVALMVALLSGDWGTAEASGTAARREASGLVAAHLQWHLERGLRSLPLVERARP